jgi:hypothetical protein
VSLGLERGDGGDFHFTKGESKGDLKSPIIVFRRHSFLSNKNYFGDIFNYPMRGLEILHVFCYTILVIAVSFEKLFKRIMA